MRWLYDGKGAAATPFLTRSSQYPWCLQLISQMLLNKLLPFLVPKPAFFQASAGGGGL